jgi:RHS repeat-associated protein
MLTLLAYGAASCAGPVGNEEGQAGEAVTLSITQTNLVGRVVSSGNGRARTFHSYDTRRRSVATQHVLDGVSYVYKTAYGFPCASDACTGVTAATNGSVAISQTFPDNEVVRYTFDSGGADQSITSTPSGGATQTIVSRVLRNARGQTIEADYGDTTSTTHHYNDAGDLRINQIETFLTATPSTISQLYTYGFDGNGNVTGVNDYCNEASTLACTTSAPNTVYSWSYQYDTRNQLVKGTRNGVVYGYTYDALGNLTNKEGVTQTYFPSGAGLPRPHALSTVGAVTYAYDANGNVSGTSGAASNLAFAWNADDMAERTVYGSATTTKSFVGESLWKKVQGGTTTYYLPSLHVENGLHRKYYGHFAERDIGDKTTCTTNASFGCLKFYHLDHLGSVTLVTNAAGSVVLRQSYKPFGDSLVATPPVPYTPEYQYTFQEKEKDGSGLYDFGAREYNPATARFLSPDSDDSDGLNRYAYVSNNPLRYNDPTGHAKDNPDPWWDIALQVVLGPPGPVLVHPVRSAREFGITAVTVAGCLSGLCSMRDLTDNSEVQHYLLNAAFIYAGAAVGAAVGASVEEATPAQQAALRNVRAIARKTEKIAHNRWRGTCARAAVDNGIRLNKAGYDAKIVVMEGARASSSHAYAEVEIPEVGTRYLSWGKVYRFQQDIGRDAGYFRGWQVDPPLELHEFIDDTVYHEGGLPSLLPKPYNKPFQAPPLK